MPTRRSFITGTSAAVAAIAMMPEGVATQTVEVATSSGGYWGISYDGEIYNQMTATSKEAAIAEALLECPEGGVSVAWCDEYPLTVPDFREAIANYMVGNDDMDLRSTLLRDAEAANEDADYEGEIAGEIFRSDSTQFLREAQLALDAALVRAGRPDLIGRDFCEEPLEASDPVVDKIEADDVLRVALDAATNAWFDRANLWNVGPRVLNLSDTHEIPRVKINATAEAV